MTVPPDDRAREDELFRQIVAGFDAETSDPVPRWPVSEDADPDERPKRTGGEAGGPGGPGGSEHAGEQPTSDPAGRQDQLDPAAAEALPGWVEPAALPDEGHYVPPEPPRLPRPRLRTALGALVLLVGLAGLLTPSSVGLDESGASLVLAMMITATGAWLLVNALSDHHDDGPDDGAVV